MHVIGAERTEKLMQMNTKRKAARIPETNWYLKDKAKTIRMKAVENLRNMVEIWENIEHPRKTREHETLLNI
jgi:hypothetical protein